MCTPFVGWLLTSRGETSGLMGAVPRTGLPGRQTLLSASALEARGWRRGRRPEYSQWPTGQGCKVAHGARGASRGGDPRTDQKFTGQTVRVPLAGRPSPELAGNVPRTGRCSLLFLTQTVSSRSRFTLPTFLLASSSSTMRRCSPTTSVVSCSLDPSSEVSTQGRQTSLLLHCCTLVFFEREPESESLNTEAARLIDCIRRKRVTSYFAMPRTGTFPMRLVRSTAERLLMIRCRVIVFFLWRRPDREAHLGFFSVTWRQPSPYHG